VVQWHQLDREQHYQRLLVLNPTIIGKNYNDAATGAKMIDLNGQVTTAVAQSAQYVTIMMGANDVCASSEATMTPVDTFAAQFRTALTTLTTGLPNTPIYVVSIPDVFELWKLFRNNQSAQTVWATLSLCQSLLARPTSNAQADVDRRNRVRQRNIDFNSALRAVCGDFFTSGRGVVR
jgi:hypothetical protein